jgi:signal transduction histidine kinase/HAMP domain-containing protein
MKAAMTLTIRQRIVLTLAPLLALLALLGIAAFLLLSRLGGRIDKILRENYDSVLYMESLKEALERIDSAFQFALAGREEKARSQYATNWEAYQKELANEENNITLPGEAELVEKLAAATREYRRDGDNFFKLSNEPARRLAYFGDEKGPNEKGLLRSFLQIKEYSTAILQLNQKGMEDDSKEARATAQKSLWWFGAGMALAVVLALLWAGRTVATILHPIRAATESALAIGAGNLDQVVEVTSSDELGQFAGAFNRMARQLREVRQSQQARIRRLQQTTQAAIDSFPHPVLVIEPAGHVELANPAACKLLGVKPAGDGAALPWQPPEPLGAPLAEALRHQQAYLPQGFDRTVPLRGSDGERFFLPRILPIRDPVGGTLGAAVLLEDVTRFRLLDEVKSNLVATVSHELKTPLSSLRLVVHLLLEETVGPLTPKQLELLLDARDNTERLLVMINNLLDLARVEEGRRQLELQSILPGDLLSAAAEEFRPRAEDRQVELTIEAAADLRAVAADPMQIGHALHNLLDNALKYTPRGGRVTLGATATDGSVVLSVADTGPGIPPEYLPHIFERFFRVPGRSDTGGTGLGLAIVREIATAHGGTATVESRMDEGTIFRVTLPVWGAATPTSGSDVPARSGHGE